MARKLPVAIVLVALVLTVASLCMPGSTSASGGVGGGGSGGGGTSGGPWGWTTYGNGWANYGINSGGPTADFHDGNLWPNIKSTCNAADAGSVMVYILGTGGSDGHSFNGKYMGYNDVFSGDWGGGGGVDNGRATKVSSATAQSDFNKLSSYDVSTKGYTWGSNVGWFCWDINPAWGKMTGSSDVKATAAPDTDVTFTHKVWDDGTIGDGKTDTIAGNVYWTGKTSGPVAAAYRVGTTFPAQVQPTKAYSTTFTPSGANGGVSRNYQFHIPKSAQDGDLYCQYISWNHTSSKNSTDGHSEQVCVKVVVPNVPKLNCNVQFPGSTNPAPGTSFTVKVNANAGGYSGSPPTQVQLELTSPVAGPQKVGPISNVSPDNNNYTYSFTISYAAAGTYTVNAKATDIKPGTGSAATCSNTITVGSPPPVTPPASVTCSMGVSPSSFITPSTPVTVSLSTGGASGFPPDDTVTYYLTMSGAISGSSTSTSMSRSGTFGLGFHSVSGSVTATDTTTGISTSNTCGTSFVVAYYPYLSIFGGDAAAGVSPLADGSAYTNTTASFLGWNDGGFGRSPGWGSAGAQWAVQALGGIYRFASARGTTATTQPYYLSFANSPRSGNTYGGSFGSGGNVQSNYKKYIAGGQLNCAGSIATTNVAAGVAGTKSCVINGADAYVGTNQTYANPSGWGIGSIPSFRLVVVGGDIYVGQGVGELDGTYVSVRDPSTGRGGTIYTCSQGPGSAASTTVSDYLSECPNQLKVYGALVATKVQFGRAYGSYTNALDSWSSSGAAEALIYGPEMWLSTGGSNDGVQAITGLPPIL